MNSAIQERLALLNMGGMPQAPKVLESLHETTSLRAVAIAHQFEQANNFPESSSKVCEVTMPDMDDAMSVTVLFINTSTGEPVGVIYNIGLGPVTVLFGSTSK